MDMDVRAERPTHPIRASPHATDLPDGPIILIKTHRFNKEIRLRTLAGLKLV